MAPRTWSKPETLKKITILGLRDTRRSEPKTDDPHMGPLGQAGQRVSVR